ncbi:MAG: hypothetical protein DI607_08190 [Sphingomonas hengshuiensis]|nr:MAG: hypothetical protein DI607_08190 [Sphingomonas hengshuiensis]
MADMRPAKRMFIAAQIIAPPDQKVACQGVEELRCGQPFPDRCEETTDGELPPLVVGDVIKFGDHGVEPRPSLGRCDFPGKRRNVLCS